MTTDSMQCSQVLELVPTFVDGEASEAVAGSVRKHLIDCAECRVIVQEEKGLRLWFEPLAASDESRSVVPEGFAARVAALAFSGSVPGSDSESEVEAASSAGDHTFGARTGSSVAARERRGPRPLAPRVPVAAPEPASSNLGFLMGLTAAAAALMVTFTLMLAQDKRLDVGEGPLSADTPLDESLRELEALNEAEKAESLAPAAEAETEAGPSSDAFDADGKAQK